MVSLDFSNAFPTLSHSFIEAALQKTQLPPFHIQFILATLVSPDYFCVGKGTVKEVLFAPKGRNWARGPLFHTIVFLLCVFCAIQIQHCHIFVFVYVCVGSFSLDHQGLQKVTAEHS